MWPLFHSVKKTTNFSRLLIPGKRFVKERGVDNGRSEQWSVSDLQRPSGGERDPAT